MTDYTIPRANAPIAGTDAPTTQWYNFLRFLDTRTSSAAGDVQAEITTIATKLGSPDGTVDNIPPLGNVSSVQGKQSIVSSGISVVQLRLVNDVDVVDPVSYYGTNSAGSKGWNLVYDAFDDTANIFKSESAGIVSFDLTDVSAGTAGRLYGLAFDTKGRVSQIHFLNVTGAAHRTIVTGGDGSGAAINITTPQDIDTTSTPTFAQVNLAADPTVALQAATKQYVDTSLSGYVPTSRTISTTAPLTGGGNLSANLTLAIPAATSSVDGYLASTDWTTFNAKVPSTRTITAGTGLSGGGDLSANRTLAIANTTVTATSYGDATHVATFTVNAQGQLTAAASTAITFPASAVTSVFGRTGAVVAATNDYTFAQIGSKPTTLSGYGITDAALAATTISAGTGLSGGGSLAANRTISLANTAVTPTTYGDSTHVGQFTVDAQGRIIAASSVAISLTSGTVTSVALTAPAIFSVAGSPITTSGTLAVTLATQSANLVWAGPTTGSSATPTFRAMVAADIPTALDKSIPAGYIDGLKMVWNSATSISATSGSCYIQGSSAVIAFPSTLTLSGLSLSASTFYHLYGFLSSGTPSIELVTTAPATAYNGTARSKTADTSRRYIGTALTDASGNLYNFQHSGDSIKYNANVAAAPFTVLSSGRAIVSTNVSLTGAVPATSKVASLLILNSDGAQTVFFANTATGAVSTTNFLSFVFNPGTATADFPVGTNQSLNYIYPSTPTGACFIRIVGYLYER